MSDAASRQPAAEETLLPNRRARWIVLFVGAVLAIALLAAGVLDVLAAVRAYIGAEADGSRARGVVFEQLRGYVVSGDEGARRAYAAALGVMQGHQQAREELERPVPRIDRVHQGLRLGGGDPRDDASMIRAYRWFIDSSPAFADARAAWRRSDELLRQLQAAARDVDLCAASERPGVCIETTGPRLDDLDAQMRVAEHDVVRHLTGAARSIERLALALLAAIALLLLSGGTWQVRRAMRRQASTSLALVEATRRWELAIAAGGIGLFDWEAERDRLTLDARAAELHGFDPGTTVIHAVDVRRRVHPDDVQPVLERAERAMQERGMLKSRYRVGSPEQGYRWLEAVGMGRRRLEAGTVEARGIVGIVRDVSDDEVRARLMIDKEAAERAAQARMAFLSRLSHELRTPLNAILGFGQLLQMGGAGALNRGQVEQIGHIVDAGRHLLHLVDEVLDVTRIDAGTMQLAMQPLDALAAVGDALRMVTPSYPHIRPQLLRDDADAAAPVMADPTRLQQVLVNVLSNACKYNRPGGGVRVRCRRAGARLCIDVEDDGIGMTAQQLQQLFQPFTRMAANRAEIDGSGLGLVISKALMQQMGGDLEAASVDGVGSCFTLRLAPAPQPAAAAPAGARPAAEPASVASNAG